MVLILSHDNIVNINFKIDEINKLVFDTILNKINMFFLRKYHLKLIRVFLIQCLVL